MGIEIFKKHLREKRAIKISATDQNLDNVAKICRCAQIAKVSAVDISGNKAAYDVARKNTKLPLFVSSIHPFEILEAVKLGVEGVQIGNYFELYKKGKTLNIDEIYDIALESMGLINQYDVYVSVSIPTTIEPNEQIKLIKKLQVLGVELFGLEGYRKPLNQQNYIESTNESIENMVELAKLIGIETMPVCSMNNAALKNAFNNGASAVNIDNSINKYESETSLKVALMELVSSISHRNSLNREIPKSFREFSLN